eukprot:TRINITY_DN10257_c0_g1_i1.p1 TRINITY_DN10257_c0_g1~~TRINITY_DN10257_c0_g1_i1.p1  ORF type:complete len:211 (+),score=45.24 TRINITY_DN10257_c0_g1_i1:85-717(+)
MCIRDSACAEPVVLRLEPVEDKAPREQDCSCPVCLNLLHEPVSTGCGHLFCRGCLLKLSNSSSQLSAESCPLCRAPLAASLVDHKPNELMGKFLRFQFPEPALQSAQDHRQRVLEQHWKLSILLRGNAGWIWSSLPHVLYFTLLLGAGLLLVIMYTKQVFFLDSRQNSRDSSSQMPVSQCVRQTATLVLSTFHQYREAFILRLAWLTGQL